MHIGLSELILLGGVIAISLVPLAVLVVMLTLVVGRWRCIKCGASNRRGAKVCPRCGAAQTG